MKKYAGVDFNEVKDTAEAKKLADEHHIEYEERHEKGDILNLFFEEYVEEHLIQPTFVMDHPSISPPPKKTPRTRPLRGVLSSFFTAGGGKCLLFTLKFPGSRRPPSARGGVLGPAGGGQPTPPMRVFLNFPSVFPPPWDGFWIEPFGGDDDQPPPPPL